MSGRMNRIESMLLAARWSAGVFLFLMAACVAIAQLPTATILGVVKDASGAVVPEASVSARDVDTGQARTATTGTDGTYRFNALPVGNYEVKVEHPSFKTVIRRGLTLTVTQEAVVDFTLEVGATAQTVEVTAEAPQVNTTSGSLGGLVNEERITTLPLNGRNFIGMTLMQSGITEHKVGPAGVHNVGNWFSSNGAPLRSNSMLLDGAILQDINGASSASFSGNTLGMDGIKEYRVITSNFSAEYGMTMGSQTVMVSKGGTNSFHGSVFEYFRNDVLDARNFFDLPTAASTRRLPAFTRNNFGGSFGGPIRKDKTFFFATTELLRQLLGITSLQVGIPASARVDGGAGGVAVIAPIIKPFLPLFPLPNINLTQFSLPASQTTSDNYGQARVDHTISASDSVFVRYTIHDEIQTTPSSTMLNVSALGGSRNQYATLAENHIFSPTLLNTLRVSFSRTGDWTTTTFPAALTGPQYSFITGVPMGSISIGGGIAGISVGPPNYDGPQNLWTVGEDLFYARGRHALKFGALVNFYRQAFAVGVGQYGSIGFKNLTDFLSGLVQSESGDLKGQPQARTYHNRTFGFYAQDDVRVNSRLTLNLGLRYEFYTVPNEVTGKNNSLRDLETGVTMIPGPIMLNPSLHNFGPRFGFAWDLKGDGKTAVRGGASYLYDVGGLGSALIQDATGKPPYNQQSTYNPPIGTILTLPFSLPAANIGTYQRPIDYNYGQPHNIQYNLAVARQLPFEMVLTLAYSGSRGLELPQIREGNPVVPGGIPNYTTGVCAPRGSQPFVPEGPHCWLGGELRRNPNWDTFTLEATGANSKYNALQVELQKRMSKGLQLQTSFTWSKNLVSPGEGSYNNQNTGKSPFAADPTWTELDYAPAVFDLPTKWNLNMIYNVPNVVSQGGVLAGMLNGWFTSALVNVQGGYPFSPGMSVNRSRSFSGGTGVGTDRPNIVPGYSYHDITHGTFPTACTTTTGTIPAGTPLGTPDHWFNPCAFTLQPAGFLGNVGSDTLVGPRFSTVDMSAGKNIPLRFLGEAGKLEFRAEVFNILNHANFNLPNRTVFNGTLANATENPLPLAGQITRTVGTSRQIQFSLRLAF